MKKTDYALGLIGLIGFGVAGFLVYRNGQPAAQVETVSASESSYSPPLNLVNDNPFGVFGSITQGAFDMVLKPRGIRNNNPLNIRWSSVNPWKGQVGKDDKGFSIFDVPENGIRAAAKNLDSYAKRGINTIEKIISTWAPPSENNTLRYIYDVESETGINRKTAIVKSRDYVKLLAAMIEQENGQQPYTLETIAAGVARS